MIEQSSDDEEKYYLWPECVDVFRIWQTLQTQWVIAGMGGVVGLNYGSVSLVMNLNGLSKRQQREFFPLIQSMEAAVLEYFRQA